MQDCNRRHDGTGASREGRFKRVLPEGSWRAMMAVAGHIHLDPLRAGVAERMRNTPPGAPERRGDLGLAGAAGERGEPQKTESEAAV